MRPQVYETLVRRIDRFEVVEESLDVFVARGEKPYSKMNLSDLFEYLSIEETDHFLAVFVGEHGQRRQNRVLEPSQRTWSRLYLQVEIRRASILGQELFIEIVPSSIVISEF